MSQFTDLCQAYTKFREVFADTRTDAYEFSRNIAFSYLGYLGIDSDSAYRLVPLNEPEKEGVKYSPAGATHLGEDGFWHLGFILNIYKAPNVYPQQGFVIDFKFIRNDDNSHIVGVDAIGFNMKVVNQNDPSEFHALFNKIHESILVAFKEQEAFLKGKIAKLPTIGFIQDDLLTRLNTEK